MITGNAVIDNGYRYLLTREWDDHSPPMVFVMLNPSTADATQDDATITRCRLRAQRTGHGHLYVVNLFALRATDPHKLTKHPDPVGPVNDYWITDTCTHTGATVVAAWGSHVMAVERGAAVLRMLGERGVRLHCLGLTNSGAPRHPLYIRSGQPLLPFGGAL